jgi:hypothetical protein
MTQEFNLVLDNANYSKSIHNNFTNASALMATIEYMEHVANVKVDTLTIQMVKFAFQALHVWQINNLLMECVYAIQVVILSEESVMFVHQDTIIMQLFKDAILTFQIATETKF